MEKTVNFDTSILLAADNPQAAGNFLKYMHSVEPELKAAQAEFAKAINAAMQKASKQFIEGEHLQLSEEAVKAMTDNCDRMCREMCRKGDKMVTEQFAQMSEYMQRQVK